MKSNRRASAACLLAQLLTVTPSPASPRSLACLKFRFDDGGFFEIVDRLKELIKYSGSQVAPAELEALLLGHPDVLDAAIVPIAHPTAGEAPQAYVVGRRFIDPQQLLIAARVAPHKRVHAVEFVERIPKSPSGKILRRELRSQPMAQALMCEEAARGAQAVLRRSKAERSAHTT
jgi:acyl-CoA synthetase (AMP-forming)/AMP-acid ligase II